MRCEEYLQDGKYLLRAELPGLDADEDVEVSVANGVLTVTSERREERKEGRRSESHYHAPVSPRVAQPANPSAGGDQHPIPRGEPPSERSLLLEVLNRYLRRESGASCPDHRRQCVLARVVG